MEDDLEIPCLSPPGSSLVLYTPIPAGFPELFKAALEPTLTLEAGTPADISLPIAELKDPKAKFGIPLGINPPFALPGGRTGPIGAEYAITPVLDPPAIPAGSIIPPVLPTVAPKLCSILAEFAARVCC